MGYDGLLVLDYNVKKTQPYFLGIPTSTDSHPRRQTFGPKPSGDCSFGSLAAEIYFRGQKSQEFRHVSTCFIMSSMFVLPHLCLPMPAFLLTCSFHDTFHSLYNFLPWLLQSMFLQLVTLWLLRPLSPQFPQQPQGPRGVHGHINSWERGMTWHMMWFMDSTW